MGGGAMFRGMARLVGAASLGAAATAAAPSCPSAPLAVCHARSFDSLTVERIDPSSVKPLDAKYPDPDDWDRSLEEDLPEHRAAALHRVVFGPTPTAEEVDEATEELQAAVLHLSIPVPPAEGGPAQSSMESADFAEPCLVDRQVKDLSHRTFSHRTGTGFITAGNSSVYQALRALQNPQVQDAVKSLALDPAVWKAVMSNEKVVELTQSLQDDDDTTTVDQEGTFTTKGETEKNVFSKFTSKVYDYVTGSVPLFLGKVMEIIGSMFGSVEKTIFSKEAGGADKTVASCMMLAVAILVVVVMKRSA